MGFLTFDNHFHTKAATVTTTTKYPTTFLSPSHDHDHDERAFISVLSQPMQSQLRLTYQTAHCHQGEIRSPWIGKSTRASVNP